MIQRGGACAKNGFGDIHCQQPVLPEDDQAMRTNQGFAYAGKRIPPV